MDRLERDLSFDEALGYVILGTRVRAADGFEMLAIGATEAAATVGALGTALQQCSELPWPQHVARWARRRYARRRSVRAAVRRAMGRGMR